MRVSDTKFNRLCVLKAIRQHGPIARSDLPTLTGVSAARITKLTAELLDRGLIKEQQETKRKNGRPKTYLEINADAGIVIGTNLGAAGALEVVFVDLAANILHTEVMQIGAHQDMASMADEMADQIIGAVAKSPFEMADIARVGVSIPGVIDHHVGSVRYLALYPQPENPVLFADRIARKTQLPVVIENDNGCLARAEHWFGRAQHDDSFTLLNIGFGIGSADYRYGLPAVGPSGVNTEIGHVKVDFGAEARPCFCGGRGCLIAYASIYGMLQAAGLLSSEPSPQLGTLRSSFDTFLNAAAHGDIAAQDALTFAGRTLGIAIANHINATSPSLILVLFQNAAFLAAVEQILHATVADNIMPGLRGTCDVRLGQIESDWRWKGAAALALEQTYLANA